MNEPAASPSDSSLAAFLRAHPAAIVAELVDVKGSAPRDSGTFMLIAPGAIWGTIGGGQFEYMAIDNARRLLAGNGETVMDIPLGPEIGQCCGGRTRLVFSAVTPEIAKGLLDRIRHERKNNPAVYLFGAGHVGLALSRALAPLPVAVTVVETRADALEALPEGQDRRLTAMPEACVSDIPAGGAAVILTHDHALDFLIAEQALARGDLAYVGMIGSATKRATFGHWLRNHRGEDPVWQKELARLVLPIGGALVKDKRPQVIAALVASELLVCLLSKAAIVKQPLAAG